MTLCKKGLFLAVTALIVTLIFSGCGDVASGVVEGAGDFLPIVL